MSSARGVTYRIVQRSQDALAQLYLRVGWRKSPPVGDRFTASDAETKVLHTKRGRGAQSNKKLYNPNIRRAISWG
jgi:hypothetical protein